MLRPRLPLLAAMMALLAPSAALAAPPGRELESNEYFSMPVLAGVDVADTSPGASTGFFWGIRPEFIFGWATTHPRRGALGFGLGPYVEAAASTGTSQVWVGGGGTVVGYFGRFGVGLSGGVDVDWVRALPSASPVFGLFLGFRTAEFGRVDLPFGVRVDFRPALDLVPATVIISTQLDVLVAATLAIVNAVMPAGHGFD